MDAQAITITSSPLLFSKYWGMDAQAVPHLKFFGGPSLSPP